MFIIYSLWESIIIKQIIIIIRPRNGLKRTCMQCTCQVPKYTESVWDNPWPGRKFTVQSKPQKIQHPGGVTRWVTAWLGLNQSYRCIVDFQTRNSNQILSQNSPGRFWDTFGTRFSTLQYKRHLHIIENSGASAALTRNEKNSGASPYFEDLLQYCTCTV